MSDKKVTTEEIHKVHSYIDQCLTKYMTKNETKEALFRQYDIEPSFTDIIWKLLEDQNQAFFREYYTRVALTKQIIEFNTLIEQQAILMRQQGFLNDASSIAADNKLNKMPASGLAENTGPALMPYDEQIVAESLANPTDVSAIKVEDSQQVQQLVNTHEHHTFLAPVKVEDFQQAQQLINSRGTHLGAIKVEDSQQVQQLVNSCEGGAPIPASAVANLQESQQLGNKREGDAADLGNTTP